MKQKTKISLEIPLFVIIFFTVGIIWVVWFSNLMSNDLKRNDVKYIIESCKKKTNIFFIIIQFLNIKQKNRRKNENIYNLFFIVF